MTSAFFNLSVCLEATKCLQINVFTLVGTIITFKHQELNGILKGKKYCNLLKSSSQKLLDHQKITKNQLVLSCVLFWPQGTFCYDKFFEVTLCSSTKIILPYQLNMRALLRKRVLTTKPDILQQNPCYLVYGIMSECPVPFSYWLLLTYP